MTRGWRPAAALAVGLSLAATSALATPDDLRTVAAMRNHARVLVVFAPRLDDSRLAAQRREFDAHALAMSERDLVLVQVADDKVIGAHDQADKLRDRHHVAANAYHTLLIGKDGNVALDIVGPISARHLSERIDAMPMRQEEVRRAREGRPRPSN